MVVCCGLSADVEMVEAAGIEPGAKSIKTNSYGFMLSKYCQQKVWLWQPDLIVLTLSGFTGTGWPVLAWEPTLDNMIPSGRKRAM